MERDGAMAEVYALLALQPVFPSKPTWLLHRLSVTAKSILELPNLRALSALGVEPASYRARDYERTQEIADAAHFLGFDGLIVPSARWDCLNLVLFTDRITPDNIRLDSTDAAPIDWDAWRKKPK
jgi:hypothetical protein